MNHVTAQQVPLTDRQVSDSPTPSTRFRVCRGWCPICPRAGAQCSDCAVALRPLSHHPSAPQPVSTDAAFKVDSRTQRFQSGPAFLVARLAVGARLADRNEAFLRQSRWF